MPSILKIRIYPKSSLEDSHGKESKDFQQFIPFSGGVNKLLKIDNLKFLSGIIYHKNQIENLPIS